MASALGPDLLCVVLPHVDRDHPATRAALKMLSGLDDSSRGLVLDALLVGPFAGRPVETVPKAMVDAAVAQDSNWRRAQRLKAVAEMFGAEPAPGALLDALWSAGDRSARLQVLARAEVTATRRTRWMRETTPGELGALLAPGTPEEVQKVIVEYVRSRTPRSVAFTEERAEHPELLERVLTCCEVDRFAFLDLLDLLPPEPDYVGVLDEGHRTYETLVQQWSSLMVWIGRTQPKIAVDLITDSLLENPYVDADDPRNKARRLAAFALSWELERTTDKVLNTFDDAGLAAVVDKSVRDAQHSADEAELWESSADVGSDELFEQWVSLLPRQHPNVGLRDPERRAKRIAFLRKRFDETIDTDRVAAALDERRGCARLLRRLLPLLTGEPEVSRPPTGLLDWDRYTSNGWASSPGVRADLASRVRGAVLELCLPYPNAGYGGGDWARLVVATLTGPYADDRPEVPVEYLRAAHQCASGWLREHPRSTYDPDWRAFEQLARTTAPAPVHPAQKRATATSVLTRLGTDPSDRDLDAVLDAAVFTEGLDVDDVLDAVPGADAEEAVVRLAGRLRDVVAAEPGPTSPRIRAQAARAVLRSRHLTREAVLAVPAFAVFGPESRPAGFGAPADEAARRVGRIVLDLVGSDPVAWRKLGNVEVANRGTDAWTSTRKVLAGVGLRA